MSYDGLSIELRAVDASGQAFRELHRALGRLTCECGHPASDHEANDGGCVYGWDEWQALDDEERAADPCECESYRPGSGR